MTEGTPRRPLAPSLLRSLERIPVALLLLDADGRIVWENREMRHLLGAPEDRPSPAMGRRLHDLPNVVAAAGNLLEAILGPEGVHGVSVDFTTIFGRTLSVAVDSGPVPRAGPAGPGQAATWLILRNLGAEHDIAGRLMTAQRLEFTGVAAAGVVHDLNNLLTALVGTVDLLRTGDATASLLDAVDSMLSRSQEVVGQLLRTARADEEEPQVYDLRTPLRQAGDLFRHGLGPGMQVVRRVPDHPVFVQGKRVGLLQALFNLGVNARDAMDGRGEIVIELDGSDPATAIVDLWDTGPGIPEPLRERVFEPFFSTKAPERGTGMGLAVVRRAVLEHGGSVQICSAPGRGAWFRLRLPRSRAPGIVDRPSQIGVRTLARVPLRGRRLLLADDEAAVRGVLARGLRAQGAEVVEVEGAAEALAQVEAGGFDAVLTDLRMPGVYGLELVERLRTLAPSLPLVALSGLHPDAEERERLDALQARFLAKPMRTGELIAATLDALRGGPTAPGAGG